MCLIGGLIGGLIGSALGCGIKPPPPPPRDTETTFTAEFVPAASRKNSDRFEGSDDDLSFSFAGASDGQATAFAGTLRRGRNNDADEEETGMNAPFAAPADLSAGKVRLQFRVSHG